MIRWPARDRACPDAASGTRSVYLGGDGRKPGALAALATTTTPLSTSRRSTPRRSPTCRRCAPAGFRTAGASGRNGRRAIRDEWTAGRARSKSTWRPGGGQTSHFPTHAVATPCRWQRTCPAVPNPRQREPSLTCSGCHHDRAQRKHVRASKRCQVPSSAAGGIRWQESGVPADRPCASPRSPPGLESVAPKGGLG